MPRAPVPCCHVFLFCLLFKTESTLRILDIWFANSSSHAVSTGFTLTPSIMHSVGPSDVPTRNYFTVEYMDLHFLTTSFYLLIVWPSQAAYGILVPEPGIPRQGAQV